jgi:hypothetical protein
MTIDLPIEPRRRRGRKAGRSRCTSTAAGRCCASACREFAKSGSAETQITFRNYVRMQYYGQLNDIEIYSPHQELREG